MAANEVMEDPDDSFSEVLAEFNNTNENRTMPEMNVGGEPARIMWRIDLEQFCLYHFPLFLFEWYSLPFCRIIWIFAISMKINKIQNNKWVWLNDMTRLFYAVL